MGLKWFRQLPGLLAAAAVLVSTSVSQAGFVLVTDRPSLGATDSVDWGQLGTTFAPVTNPVGVLSMGGVALTASQTQPSGFQRRDEGSGWGGNFTYGDALLWTAGAASPNTLSITTASGFSAGGTQIQADFYGPFTARVTAFDGLGNALASFTEDGVSTGNDDGSAIFIGIASTAGEKIASIGFSLDTAYLNPGDFAINTFSFSPATVPEPTSLALVGLGAVSLIGYRVRRKRVSA